MKIFGQNVLTNAIEITYNYLEKSLGSKVNFVYGIGGGFLSMYFSKQYEPLFIKLLFPLFAAPIIEAERRFEEKVICTFISPQYDDYAHIMTPFMTILFSDNQYIAGTIVGVGEYFTIKYCDHHNKIDLLIGVTGIIGGSLLSEYFEN